MLGWDKLRSDVDKRGSFEELCCQLARHEKVPPNSTFRRLAPPDAGVECYWTLQDGSEWGWQAKYFLESPSAAGWAQIDESVKKALKARPRLTKYFVCLPVDRSDGKREGQTSFLCRWEQHVEKWQRDKNIEFEYWGSSEIEDRLSRDEHRGRHKYFFDKEFLSSAWFEKHIDDAVSNAGLRYHPELNVELPIAKIFDALGRTQRFYSELGRISKEIIKDTNYAVPRSTIREAESEFNELNSTINVITGILRRASESEQKPIDFSKIHEFSEKAEETIHEIIAKLEGPHKERGNDFGNKIYHLRRLEEHLSKLKKCAKRDFCLVANTGALLIRGDAGVGKTHLLCDVAKHRCELGHPGILLHGGHFIGGNPKETIMKELELGGTFDDLLAALNIAGQANGSKSLIMIDALNEGDGHRIWPGYLHGILNAISKYKWVGIAISVRSIYESAVIPVELGSEKLSRITHRGFEGKIDDAIKMFFDNNGIERPSIPLLAPEFYNPQFLIILCSGLQNMNMTRIPNDLQGLTSVYGFFIDSIDKKLSQSNMLDYSEHEEITRRAVDVLAENMASKNSRFLEYQEADRCLNEIHPTTGHSRSLIRNLISEGLLSEERMSPVSNISKHVVQFTYERLADHMIVQNQLKNKSEKDLLTLFGTNGDFEEHFSAGGQHRGMLDALSVQIPEKFKKELIEIEPRLAGSDIALRSFLDSLVWRRPDSITGSSLSLIEKHMLRKKYCLGMLFKVLLTISADPSNPLNGDYLHGYLFKLEMNDRDSSWSIFLHQDYSANGSIVKRHIDWAWHANKASLRPKSIYLTSLALAWFLTSSNRSIRDKATKALVSLWSARMDILVGVLQKFDGCNDPYVVERLFCAAYGCAMRSDDIDQLKELAQYTYSVIFKDGKPPPNILLRDYARRIVECALHKEIDLDIEPDKLSPPYSSDWIESFPSETEIDELEQTYSETGSTGALQIFRSLGRMGDFYRYIIGGNSKSFQWSSIRLLPNRLPRMQLLDQFDKNLKNNQLPYWQNYLAGTSTKEELRQRLNKSQRDILDRHVSPCVELLSEQNRRDIVPDLHEFARWIVKKVFALGWFEERFEMHDRGSSQYRLYRSRNPNERIGKKYQWIAYYELLARVSDNFEFFDGSGLNALGIYDGPWQLFHLRNIDPSLLPAEATKNSPDSNHAYRGDESFYDAWDSPIDDVQWLKNTQDLPNPKSLIEINQDDGSEWLALGGDITLEQPVPVDQEPYELPRRSIFFLLESCLTRKTNINKLYNWSKELSSNRGEFPEPPSFDNLFLGELYWDIVVGQPAHFEPSYIESHVLPYNLPVRSITSTYMHASQASGYDHSSDGETMWRLPNKLLVEKMNLKNKEDGTFVNLQGEIVAYDPSVLGQDASVLLVRKEEFNRFLLENNYRIVWRLIGRKTIIGGAMSDSRNRQGELEIDGSYKIVNRKIKGTSNTSFIEPPK